MGQNHSLGLPGDGSWEGNGNDEERSLPQGTPRPRRPTFVDRSSVFHPMHPYGYPPELGTDPRHSLPEMLAHPQQLWESLRRGFHQRAAGEAAETTTGMGGQGSSRNTTTHGALPFGPLPEGQSRDPRPPADELHTDFPLNVPHPLMMLSQQLRRHQEQLASMTRRSGQRQSRTAAETASPNTPDSTSRSHPRETSLMQLFMAAAAAEAAVRRTERQRQESLNRSSSQDSSSTASTDQSSTRSSMRNALHQMLSGLESSRPQTDRSTTFNGATGDTGNSSMRETLEHVLFNLDSARPDADRGERTQTGSTSPENFVRVFRLDGHDEGSLGDEPGATTTGGASNTSTASSTGAAEGGNDNATANNNADVAVLIPVIIVGVRSLAQANAETTQGSSTTGSNVESTPAAGVSSSTESGLPNSSASNTSTADAGSSSRSWLIYIVGGSYPADHPILRMSDLNLSENATYEDLIRLSEFLGPARPIAVTQADIDAANLEVRTLCTEDLADLRATTVDVDVPMSGSENNEGAAPMQMDDVSSGTATTTTTSQPTQQANKRRRDSISSPDAELATPRRRCRRRLSGRESMLTGDQCTVCLSVWAIGDVVRILDCRHSFHRDCVDRWLKEGADRCPVCRAAAVRRPNIDTKAEVESSNGGSIPAAGQ